MLTINRGIQAVIRIIDDIVCYLISVNKIMPKQNSMEYMLDEVEYYLLPLVTYINNLSDEQRKDLKGFLGGGADNKFWRSTFKMKLNNIIRQRESI